MSIYTYTISQSISKTLGIQFTEIPELSDQELHKISHESDCVIVGPYTKHIERMSQDERNAMTSAANERKRGMKESDRSRGIKSVAQKERWQNMTEEQRKAMGKLSREGISEEGRIKQTQGMLEAFSPVRQKGYKHPLTTCPHCAKVGGLSAMKKYHFNNCKRKLS